MKATPEMVQWCHGYDQARDDLYNRAVEILATENGVPDVGDDYGTAEWEEQLGVVAKLFNKYAGPVRDKAAHRAQALRDTAPFMAVGFVDVDKLSEVQA